MMYLLLLSHLLVHCVALPVERIAPSLPDIEDGNALWGLKSSGHLLNAGGKQQNSISNVKPFHGSPDKPQSSVTSALVKPSVTSPFTTIVFPVLSIKSSTPKQASSAIPKSTTPVPLSTTVKQKSESSKTTSVRGTKSQSSELLQDTNRIPLSTGATFERVSKFTRSTFPADTTDDPFLVNSRRSPSTNTRRDTAVSSVNGKSSSPNSATTTRNTVPRSVTTPGVISASTKKPRTGNAAPIIVNSRGSTNSFPRSTPLSSKQKPESTRIPASPRRPSFGKTASRGLPNAVPKAVSAPSSEGTKLGTKPSAAPVNAELHDVQGPATNLTGASPEDNSELPKSSPEDTLLNTAPPVGILDPTSTCILQRPEPPKPPSTGETLSKDITSASQPILLPLEQNAPVFIAPTRQQTPKVFNTPPEAPSVRGNAESSRLSSSGRTSLRKDSRSEIGTTRPASSRQQSESTPAKSTSRNFGRGSITASQSTLLLQNSRSASTRGTSRNTERNGVASAVGRSASQTSTNSLGPSRTAAVGGRSARPGTNSKLSSITTGASTRISSPDNTPQLELVKPLSLEELAALAQNSPSRVPQTMVEMPLESTRLAASTGGTLAKQTVRTEETNSAPRPNARDRLSSKNTGRPGVIATGQRSSSASSNKNLAPTRTAVSSRGNLPKNFAHSSAAAAFAKSSTTVRQTSGPVSPAAVKLPDNTPPEVLATNVDPNSGKLFELVPDYTKVASAGETGPVKRITDDVNAGSEPTAFSLEQSSDSPKSVASGGKNSSPTSSTSSRKNSIPANTPTRGASIRPVSRVSATNAVPKPSSTPFRHTSDSPVSRTRNNGRPGTTNVISRTAARQNQDSPRSTVSSKGSSRNTVRVAATNSASRAKFASRPTPGATKSPISTSTPETSTPSTKPVPTTTSQNLDPSTSTTSNGGIDTSDPVSTANKLLNSTSGQNADEVAPTNGASSPDLSSSEESSELDVESDAADLTLKAKSDESAATEAIKSKSTPTGGVVTPRSSTASNSRKNSVSTGGNSDWRYAGQSSAPIPLPKLPIIAPRRNPVFPRTAQAVKSTNSKSS